MRKGIEPGKLEMVKRFLLAGFDEQGVTTAGTGANQTFSRLEVDRAEITHLRLLGFLGAG